MPQIAILTRPEGRNEALAGALRHAGWDVLVLPALKLSPLPADANDFPLPEQFGLVIFVSGFAAKSYFRQLRDVIGHAVWPVHVPIGTVGPASAAAVREMPGVGAATTVYCPPASAPDHDSEALWRVLRARASLPQRVLIVRGTHGRDWLAEKLAANGVLVRVHAAYRRMPSPWPTEALQQLRIWSRDSVKATWLLTSGEGLAAIVEQIRAASLQGWWRNCDFVATHPRIAAQLRQGGSTEGNAVVKTCLPAEDKILAAFLAA